jgi:hypothetical protein
LLITIDKIVQKWYYYSVKRQTFFKRRKIMKKIISCIIAMLFIISAMVPFTSVSAADATAIDLLPDGSVVYVPNFNGEVGVYEPGLLSGTPQVDVDPYNNNTIYVQTTKDKTGSYWGGFIETLPLNENTCYTIYYSVTRTGKHSVGLHVDSVYGVYGYPERIKLMNKGSSLSGHDYHYFETDAINVPTVAEEYNPVTHEYALEVNGVNSTLAIYVKDNAGTYQLIDESYEGDIPYFNADVLGLFFYSYYANHIATISNVYITKGLSWGTVVYPETTEAPETTKAPEKSGCGSSVAFGGMVIVAILGTAIVFKKR